MRAGTTITLALASLLACGDSDAPKSKPATPSPPPSTEPIAVPKSALDTTARVPGPPDGRFTAIECRGLVYCGLRDDGKHVCWGQLAADPVLPGGTFKALGSGRANICGIRAADATIACPPEPDYPSTAQNGAIGVPTPEPVIQLVGGQNFRCALSEAGAIACRGGNELMVPRPPSGAFRQIVAGGDFLCALDDKGAVICSKTEGDDMALDGGPFRTLSAGEDLLCGITRDKGSVRCTSPAPGNAKPPPGEVKQVVMGSGFRCGLYADGNIHCWGLVIGGIDEPPTGAFTAIAAASVNVCALATDGTVHCWGSGYTVTK